MISVVRFRATLEPVSHGGYFVAVPDEVAARAGVRYGDRVRGTVNGAAYRSSLMKYSGVFHLGVPKNTLVAAGAGRGDAVQVTLEPDPELLPTDVVPDDLALALDRDLGVRAAYERLSPAHRRMHVKYVIEAQKPETRARRIERTVKALAEKPIRPGQR